MIQAASLQSIAQRLTGKAALQIPSLFFFRLRLRASGLRLWAKWSSCSTKNVKARSYGSAFIVTSCGMFNGFWAGNVKPHRKMYVFRHTAQARRLRFRGPNYPGAPARNVVEATGGCKIRERDMLCLDGRRYSEVFELVLLLFFATMVVMIMIIAALNIVTQLTVNTSIDSC